MTSDQAVEVLAALGQRSRLDVFQLLVKAGPEGLNAGDIARTVGAPANTMSVHLGILSRAGLITAQRNGRSIAYSLNVSGVRELFSFLTDDCCGGRPELCGPFAGDNACSAPTCAPPKHRGRDT